MFKRVFNASWLNERQHRLFGHPMIVVVGGVTLPAIYVTFNPFVFGRYAVLSVLQPLFAGLVVTSILVLVAKWMVARVSGSVANCIAGALYAVAFGYFALTCLASLDIAWSALVSIAALVLDASPIIGAVFLMAFIPPWAFTIHLVQARPAGSQPFKGRDLAQALFGGIVALAVPITVQIQASQVSDEIAAYLYHRDPDRARAAAKALAALPWSTAHYYRRMLACFADENEPRQSFCGERYELLTGRNPVTDSVSMD
jgi:hypothetical protein